MLHRIIPNRIRRKTAALLGAAAFTAILAAPMPDVRAAEEPFVLLIQPILSEEKTREAYGPLCAYIERLAGRPCTVLTQPNFLAYWDVIRRNNYDLVLDASHFTDYRVQKMGFSILAKIPDSVSYSLIVPDSNLVFDPTELVARRIATLGPPSIGAARLSAMFPNPLRQPVIIEVASAEEGMDLVVAKKVEAAILPTPLVSQRMSQAGGIAVVLTTEPIPHIALSASPRVAREIQERIRDGLLNAAATPAGRRMLEGIGFEKFDPATPALYANQSNILKTYWGY